MDFTRINQPLKSSFSTLSLLRARFNIKELFLFSLFISVLSGGCKKEMNYHTVIKGAVLESGSGKRIGGATVILGKANKGSTAAYAYQTAAFCTSDANGNYSFDFTADASLDYVVVAKKPPYFDSDWHSPLIGQTNSINIPLNAPSYIKFHVKNINLNQVIGLYGTFNPSYSLYGAHLDTIFTSSPIISGSQDINWSVWSSTNVRSDFYGHTTTTPFDTIPFNINY